MLVAGVPPYYRDEARLRKLYGDETRKIWLPRTDKGLLKLVEERQQTAARLERAEVQLIKKANMARRRWLQKNGHEVDEGKIAVPENGQQPDTNVPGRQDSERSGSTQITEVEKDSRRFQDVTTETATYQDRERSAGTAAALHAELNPEDEYAHPYGLEPTLPDVRGSVAAKWLPVEARPRHRPLGNFMHSVDTIHWTRDRLGQLNQQIHKLRRSLRRGDGTAIPAAFIEFTSPSTAQAAHQVVAHHRPLQMSTRLIGVRPDEVLWPSLRMTWWERLLKRTAAMALIAVAIVFWSVPSAVIGMVSNIEFLANIPFMSWLEELPTPVLGFLQGFVPALALSLWMALVPAMIRGKLLLDSMFKLTVAGLARFSGSPTTVLTELFVQKAYFAFQVVQVFLVTTITTAASNALLDIVEDPSSAPEFLAQNIPRASNFYISYILIQCLAAGAFGLLHLFDMLRHFILPRVSELPRTRFRVWSRMRMVYWGGIFPVFSNLGVIGEFRQPLTAFTDMVVLAYAFIAPLILIFGAAGMWFIYVVYKYNLLYVFESAVDSKGLFYPRALLHIMVGLYIAEACLAGLLGINKAFGPLAIVIVFVLCTILVHFTLSDALAPLLQNLPQTLATEEDLQAEMKALRENVQAERPHQEGGAAASYFDPEVGFGDEEDLSEGEEQDSDSEEHDPVTQNRAMEGSGSVGATLFAWLKASAATRIRDEAEESGLNRLLTKTGLRRADGEPPSLVNRWLRPPDFVALRRSIPAELATVEAPGDNGRRGYSPPELWMPKPMLWIPKDEARVSRQEVAHSKRVVRIADQGAGLSVRGRVVISGTMEESPLVDDIDLYR